MGKIKINKIKKGVNMPVPKKKMSKSRRDMRRSSNSKIQVRNLAKCSRCGSPRLPHRACPKCGFYKNMVIEGIVKEVKKK